MIKRFLFIFMLNFILISCSSAMNNIRTVHMGVREAGRLTDIEIAPRLSAHGEICITRANNAGFGQGSGQEGIEHWYRCMNGYMHLTEAVSAFRTSLEELENIYQDIENGMNRESDWMLWVGRVVDHGRTIIRLCDDVDLDIPDGFQENLNLLCTMTNCEG